MYSFFQIKFELVSVSNKLEDFLVISRDILNIVLFKYLSSYFCDLSISLQYTVVYKCLRIEEKCLCFQTEMEQREK